LERRLGSVCRECLDRLLIIGRRRLGHLLPTWLQQYNQQRRHRALDLKPPDSSARSPVRVDSNPQDLQVRRHDRLGGLIHEYELAAA
jgi:putative transposase